MFKRKLALGSLACVLLISVVVLSLVFNVRVKPFGFVSIGVGSCYAATESLYPTGQVTWTNLDGSYLDVDDDPDSPDGNWADPISNNADTIAHVSFDTPTGNLNTGAGLQEVRVWVKKWNGTGDPDLDIQLYENGVLVAELLAATPVTSTTGELFSATWDASLLTNVDGSGVEFYVHGKKSGGAPSARATVAVGAVEWNADYSACSANITNAPNSKDYGVVTSNTTYDTGLSNFSVTNNSGGAASITIQGTDMTGVGTDWTLSDTATPGADTCGLKAGLSGADYTIIVKKNSPYNDLVSGLADSGTQDWGLRLYTPTSYSNGNLKTGVVTLTATCD